MNGGDAVSDTDFLEAVQKVIDESSQEKVAQDTGMSQGHLSKVMRGTVPLTQKARAKLVQGLGLIMTPAAPGADAVVRLTTELEALPAEMREPIGNALLAALAVLQRFNSKGGTLPSTSPE